MRAASAIPEITTERLRLDAFTRDDVPALAAILADPEVSANITTNASTPERCRASAELRIGWHNRSWSDGYGVWAVRVVDEDIAPAGTLLGWCGFAAPDIGDDPEILYGLASAYWGRGLAREMVRAAIDWLFAETAHGGISAVIFGRLNPVSVRIAEKFGMRRRGSMSIPDFMPDRKLAWDVLDYEIWRLGHAPARDPAALLFHAAYKGGQIATLEVEPLDVIEARFLEALRQRTDLDNIADAAARVRAAFREGAAAPFLDWYHLARADWPARK